jgi:hypothetical protein
MDSVVRNVVEPKFDNINHEIKQLQKQIVELKSSVEVIKKNQNDILQILHTINIRHNLAY